jgi:hypothetical protein
MIASGAILPKTRELRIGADASHDHSHTEALHPQRQGEIHVGDAEDDVSIGARIDGNGSRCG